jgi:hypothetical protein
LTLIVTIVVAAAIHFAIEQPIETLRLVIRERRAVHVPLQHVQPVRIKETPIAQQHATKQSAPTIAPNE